MAKKQSASSTFTVRFVGKALSPATLPLRAVNNALSAVQDLASGRDPFETAAVPAEQMVGLVDVKAGSASYLCVARTPRDAVRNLNEVGRLLTSLENDGASVDEERLVTAIRPIRTLSKIAERNDCRLEIALAGQQQSPLFVVEKRGFSAYRGASVHERRPTVTGTIKRTAALRRCDV